MGCSDGFFSNSRNLPYKALGAMALPDNILFDASRYGDAHHAQDVIYDDGAGGKSIPDYGTAVQAMNPGTVVAAQSGYGPAQSQYPNCQRAPGNFVKIRENDAGYDGYYTIYFHMTPSVTVGQHVSRGDIIGHLDNSGCQTAAHVHVARKDTSGNPVNFTIPCVNPVPWDRYFDNYGTIVDDWVPDDI